jgi:hypothetical protein
MPRQITAAHVLGERVRHDAYLSLNCSNVSSSCPAALLLWLVVLNELHPPNAATPVTGVAVAQIGTRRAVYEVRKNVEEWRIEARAATQRSDIVVCQLWWLRSERGESWWCEVRRVFEVRTDWVVKVRSGRSCRCVVGW